MTTPNTLLLLDGSLFLPKAIKFGRTPEKNGSVDSVIHYVEVNIRTLPRMHQSDHVLFILDKSILELPMNSSSDCLASGVTMRSAMDTVREMLSLLHWKVVLVSNDIDAHLMATIATRAVSRGLKVKIATENKLLYPLASEYISFPFASDELRNGIVADNGIKASQLVDYYALVGTKVTAGKPAKLPGVGAKIAVKLLRKHGSLETILEAASDMENRLGEVLQVAASSLLAERNSMLANTSFDTTEIFPSDFSMESFRISSPDYGPLREYYLRHGNQRMADYTALGDVRNLSVSTINRKLKKDTIPSARDLKARFIVDDKFRGAIGVYAIVNKATKQRYFGSSIAIERRAIEHMRLLEGNAHSNWLLNEDFQKYGSSGFDFRVIDTCSSLEQAKRQEQFYLDMFWGRANCYNISPLAVESSQKEVLYILVSRSRPVSKAKRRADSRSTALESGHGVYLTVHAAARDLRLSKSDVLRVLAERGSVLDGWSFTTVRQKWKR